MMETDDDIQPLMYDDVGGNREIYLQLTSQSLDVDPDFDKVIYTLY